MITITPLGEGGGSSSSKATSRALCHLIRVDSSYLLLDCGAPEDLIFPPTPSPPPRPLDLASYILPDGDLDTEALTELPLDDAIQLIAPRISLVLLSHSTLHHVGLYAYAKARLGLTCPAYATLPVAAMGRLVTVEAITAIAADCDVDKSDKRPQQGTVTGTNVVTAVRSGRSGRPPKGRGAEPGVLRNRCTPTKSEVDDAFEGIRTLRYLQPTGLDGPLSSLSLSAHSAGHTLGGTVWKLRSPTSGTVVLAIDWNHVKERHIDGSGVIDAVSSQAAEAAGTKRADLFVTSGAAVDKINLRRKDKDKRLLDLIHHTLTVSKSTLHLPVDASPRLLEILLLLDQHWAFSYPHARFPLCLVSRTGKEVLERARTMREWMGKTLQGEDAGRTSGAGARTGGRDARDGAHGPLDFRFLRIFTSLGALDAALPAETPKIVLTVGPSLLYGPSLNFFRDRVAPHADNTIVLTQRSELISVAQQLRGWWETGQGEASQQSKAVGSEVSGDGRELQDVIVRQRLPLQGHELEAYNEEKRLRKEKDDQHKALLARSRQRLEADQEEDSDEDDGDDDKAEDSDDDLEAGLPEDPVGFSAVTLDGNKGRGSRKLKDLTHSGAGDALGGEGDMTLLGSSLSHDIYLRGDSAHASNFFNPLRGNVDTNLEQEAAKRHGVGVRYRTAPVIEKRKRIDAFGEVVDVARWLSRGRAVDAAEASNAKGTANTAAEASRKRRRLDGEADADDDLLPPQEDEDEFKDIPTKFTEEATNITVRCNIVCIDLEGLIDGRALSIVLPQLAPRRLVLVGCPQPLPSAVPAHKKDLSASSPATATSRFIDSLLGIKDFTREIFAPALGRKVSVGAEVHSFDVKLGEGVLEQLRISGWEDWGIAWLQARVTGAVEEDVREAVAGLDAKTPVSSSPALIALEKISSGRESTSEVEETNADEADALKAVYRPKSKVLASSRVSTSGIPRQHTFFIGDVRLSKLKALLSAAHRIPSEFGGGGMLVCGAAALAQATGQSTTSGPHTNPAGPLTANQAAAAVTVQKFGEKFILEGNAGRTFVKVRDVMYGMHARVGDI
ncbi:hypothetical protein BCV69DRAFT_313612 [Microstroma glucosiphilum]|uniref:Cleavage and polyadenylation specificity factor subunit 2 n=1 Tax=Pseudomicrostroma glucosiphilum TaxID=1684307 RepID=A0A316U3K0_9BASI|nr:hypothetical protein BCV69DRAFT_313612 [Pseudomicrostroma glucosiphilum]PWN19876.1 hypothetical protein BCV69DRAFT_313612 [Pseudomicrostroma glucosiphilum]